MALEDIDNKFSKTELLALLSPHAHCVDQRKGQYDLICFDHNP